MGFSNLFFRSAVITGLGLFLSAPQRDSGFEALPSPSDSETCVSALRDQRREQCLFASSTPTPGFLFPPPHDGGVGNTVVGDSFVGGGCYNSSGGFRSVTVGGESNQSVFAEVGGGRANVSRGGTIGGGYANTTYSNATIGGGVGNADYGYPDCTVGGGARNQAYYYYGTVGGGADNLVVGGGGTAGGGRSNLPDSSVFSGFSTILGGYGNAADLAGTVLGGKQATVSGSFFLTAYGAVGGGASNACGPVGACLGGKQNFSSSTGVGALAAAVGGGAQCRAVQTGSCVPGGDRNQARRIYSFAAGRRADATHNGAWVWADSQDVAKPSSRVNEFNVYASGGARFFTSAAAMTGVLLAPGAGSWSHVSDRRAKENFSEVRAGAILEALCRTPLWTWNYREQDDSTRHMGPMSQDFHQAFGLGSGAKTIDTIDADGVALAAIRGLYQRFEVQEGTLRELARAQAVLRSEVQGEMESVRTAMASTRR